MQGIAEHKPKPSFAVDNGKNAVKFLHALQIQIQPGSTATKAKFKSNLLGSLGAGVFVGPNTINFNTVFNNLDQKLIEVIRVSRLHGRAV